MPQLTIYGAWSENIFTADMHSVCVMLFIVFLYSCQVRRIILS